MLAMVVLPLMHKLEKLTVDGSNHNKILWAIFFTLLGEGGGFGTIRDGQFNQSSFINRCS